MNTDPNSGTGTIVVTLRGAYLLHETPLKVSIHITSPLSPASSLTPNPDMVGGLTVDIHKGTAIISKLRHDTVAIGAWITGETTSQHHGPLCLSGLGSQSSLFATTGDTRRKSTLTLARGLSNPVFNCRRGKGKRGFLCGYRLYASPIPGRKTEPAFVPCYALVFIITPCR